MNAHSVYSSFREVAIKAVTKLLVCRKDLVSYLYIIRFLLHAILRLIVLLHGFSSTDHQLIM